MDINAVLGGAYFASFIVATIFAVSRARYLIVFNPIFHFLVFNLFFILPNVLVLKDVHYQAVALVGLIFFVAGFIAGWREVGYVRSSHMFRSGSFQSLLFMACIVGLGFFLTVSLFIIKGVSLVSFVSDPIGSTSTVGKSNVALEALKNSLLAPVFSYFLIQILERKSVGIFFLVTLLVMKLLFIVSTLTTGRFLYIYHAAVVVALYTYSRNIQFRWWVQIGVVSSVFAVFPILLYVLNILRHGYYDQLGKINLMESYVAITADLNPGTNLAALIKYLEYEGYNYGLFLFMIPLSIVPRGIWPDKPITSSQFYYTQKVFGVDPIRDVTTFTFTIYDVVSIAGIWLMPFFMVAIGFFYSKAYMLVLQSKNIAIKGFLLTVTLGSINVFRTNLQDALFLMAFNVCVAVVVTACLDSTLYRIRKVRGC